MVAGGTWTPSRKLWQLYGWSYTAGIRPPSATRDKVTVSVVLPRESDQARSHTIHNHDRSCVWQQGLTLRRRQQNRIELYALVNPKRISDIYFCVVTLCLTCFYAWCFSWVIIVFVKFLFPCYHELWWIKMNIKAKREKVQGAWCRCMTGVNYCSVIGNTLGGIWN